MSSLVKGSAVSLALAIFLATLWQPSVHAAWRLSQSTDASPGQNRSGPNTQKAAPSTPEAAPQAQDADHADIAPGKTEDGTPATVIDDRDAEAILGKSVYSAANEDMGRIVDVIVKRTGEVRAAVIDFGGFLGVGSRKIAVDWSALRFPTSGPMDHINLELTSDQVRLAPEYKSGEPLVVLGSAEAQSKPEPPNPEQ